MYVACFMTRPQKQEVCLDEPSQDALNLCGLLGLLDHCPHPRAPIFPTQITTRASQHLVAMHMQHHVRCIYKRNFFSLFCARVRVCMHNVCSSACGLILKTVAHYHTFRALFCFSILLFPTCIPRSLFVGCKCISVSFCLQAFTWPMHRGTQIR